MPFPSPPWQLEAQLWLSVFVLRSPVGERPAGVYGAAFVDYTDGGVLTYHELLVARLHDARSRQVRITDIWVDSPTSLAGGRSLWAIPKELADLPMRTLAVGPATRTSFSAVAAGQQVARGAFTSLPGAALVRAPFRLHTAQERSDGSPVVTPFGGSARALPCRASWRFDAGGPLAFLAGRRPVLSLRLTDARLSFG
ncbi:MAG: acetoacetate decarboxylase family protein [Nocardioidaceae bacterium]